MDKVSSPNQTLGSVKKGIYHSKLKSNAQFGLLKASDGGDGVKININNNRAIQTCYLVLTLLHDDDGNTGQLTAAECLCRVEEVSV